MMSTPSHGATPSYRELADQDLPYTEIIREGYRATGSVSIGTTLTGRLTGSVALPAEGPHHRILEDCRPRDTHHGTEELIQLVQDASRAVMAAEPGPRVGVCNLSHPKGGALKWSQSHNSGRDADLAFFVRDLETNEPVDAPGLIVFGRSGIEFAETPRFRFDVARNWLLVRALLTHPSIVVQWILVDRRLKRRMLAHAAERGAPAELLERASKVLHQPSDAHRHNDHFHVRIYCSWDDRADGCLDTDPYWPWRHVDPAPLRRRTAALSFGLRDPNKKIRGAVLEHLKAMEGFGASPAVAEMAIMDADHRLRGKAGSLLLSWRAGNAVVIDAITRFITGPGGGILSDGGATAADWGERVERPVHHIKPWRIGEGRERSANHLHRAYKLLAKLASLHTTPFLMEALGSKRVVGDPDDKGSLEARMAARVAIHVMDLTLVPSLITHLNHPKARVRSVINLAIRRITNHVVRGNWGGRTSPEQLQRNIARWRAWWEAHSAWTRDEMVSDGFKRRGHRFVTLDHKDNIPRLIRLTKRTDEIGYNADRLLVRITQRVTPRGATAAKKHARWTKWFPDVKP
ncbi:MAG: penicillin-insensitive murein endopeptidase [Myxococcota bacterium]